MDMNEAIVIKYQNDRLTESAAPKTVNEEVGFLLRIIGRSWRPLRVRLKKKKNAQAKGRERYGKGLQRGRKRTNAVRSRKSAFTPYLPGLTLALNAGVRDAESGG